MMEPPFYSFKEEREAVYYTYLQIHRIVKTIGRKGGWEGCKK
jgi:hypothetical protein